MLNTPEDQLLDDVVSRVEQSRFSYKLQTEEFRNLNTNFQTYLNDTKIIDDANRQLQENIEQIRTNYIITLENHLKRLPEDFRQESHILTEAHIERYKSKSRAKRFINEREELKKRIHFVASNEKDQIKRLNNLQKQERLIENEFKIINEQIQNLYNYLQTEKQIHQQAMDKVDNLQVQLEQICIERSKTEFENQTLREEVKLMQTAKEFLDEEHQTILSTQTEANEYFLSRLNDSITHIREDFNELNQNQLQQLENEYKQIIKNLEETFLTNETILNHQRTIQISYEKLQDEHEILTQELTILNDHNQILSEQILHMETDLDLIRDERKKELIIKDNECERSQIELQTLYEKLNHLNEYDRNLKFELTLYRGVLESEYRRKQQQLINNQHPVRPTTLRTTTIRTNKNSSILTNLNQLEPIVEKINPQIDDHDKIENENELDRQDGNATTEEKHQTPTGTSKSPISTLPTDQLSPTISPMNQEASLTSTAPPSDLSSSLDDRQISSEISNVLISPTDPTLPEDQPTSSDILQSPVTSSEVQKLSESPPANEEPSLTSAPPVSSEDHQIPTDTEKLSSIPPSTDSEIPSEAQESSTTPTVSQNQPESSEVLQSSLMQQEDRQESSTTPTVSQDQPESSEVLQSSSIQQEDRQESSSTPTVSQDPPESSEVLQSSSMQQEDRQESSTTPTVSQDQPESSEVLQSSLMQQEDRQESSSTPTVSQDQPESSEVLQSASIQQEDRQESSGTPTVSQDQPGSSEVLQSSLMQQEDRQESSTTPTVSQDQPESSEVLQSSSIQQEDRQESSSTPTVSEDQLESSEVLQSSSIQPEESSEVQELSTTTPKDEEIPSETKTSPTSSINTVPPTDLSPPELPDSHQTTSDVQQSSNISSNEQPMLPESLNTPSQEDRSFSPDIQQKTSTPSQEQPTSSEIQQSPMTDDNVQEQPSSVATDEHQTSVSDDIPANSTKGEVDGDHQLADLSEEYDNLNEHEDKTNSSTYETDDLAHDRHESIQSTESLPMQEHEINQTEDNESTIEEQLSSSDQNQFAKDNKISYTSSTDYYGTRNDSIHSINQELSKQSLTDGEDNNTNLIEEVDLTTSPKIEEKEFDDNKESNLEAVMQDLRYVYRSLTNEDDLVEINNDFPDSLIDSLEFGDNFIRTLFDGLLRKYIVQPAKTGTRSKTLDWIEFRNILFPILTGRYTEGHIRKLFNLFDINKNGYLSIQEIAALLELLQVNNSDELAQNMANQDETLNVDEFIEAIKNADDVNNNILSEEIENKHWYSQHPTDEGNNDTQSIEFEVPTVNFPSKINNGIILLSRIFKRVGADFKNKQLDSTKPTLSMKITNEFIHNNVHISSNDLQLFIELYLNKKQNSDYLINWIEFRDIFSPFVNGGMFSKDDLIRWFDILDINHNKTISQEQILHLLRLLQVLNPEKIFNEIQEIYPNNNNSWTFEELFFALENIDETTTHFLTTNEQTTSFDLDWFIKNIF